MLWLSPGRSDGWAEIRLAESAKGVKYCRTGCCGPAIAHRTKRDAAPPGLRLPQNPAAERH